MTQKEMTTTHQEVATRQTQDQKPLLSPPVDIFENEDAITLIADLPGVTQETLQVKVEDGLLTLEGESEGLHQGAVQYREFQSAIYHRTFKLGDNIDAQAIGAALKNGVLHLTLPKAESAKPRKIEINTTQ